MKAVILVEGSSKDFQEAKEVVKDLPAHVDDTSDLYEEDEYKYLFREIEKFVCSSREIFISRFSGNEDVAKALGDESSEMIIPISYNRKSSYYSGSSVRNTLSELVCKFQTC